MAAWRFKREVCRLISFNRIAEVLSERTLGEPWRGKTWGTFVQKSPSVSAPHLPRYLFSIFATDQTGKPRNEEPGKGRLLDKPFIRFPDHLHNLTHYLIILRATFVQNVENSSATVSHVKCSPCSPVFCHASISSNRSDVAISSQHLDPATSDFRPETLDFQAVTVKGTGK